MISLEKIAKIKQAKQPFKLADIIAFAAAAVLIVVLFVVLFSGNSDTVSIYIDGKLSKEYSLSTNREVNIDGHLTLKIENMTCWVVDVDCPDKVCQYTGKIRYNGQSIVCLPNKIVIIISGSKGGFDTGV